MLDLAAQLWTTATSPEIVILLITECFGQSCYLEGVAVLLETVKFVYYNIYAGSASGQDEANPVFRLATRAGKMGPSFLFGIARFGPAEAKLWCNLFPI